jgi:hypothetical protein
LIYDASGHDHQPMLPPCNLKGRGGVSVTAFDGIQRTGIICASGRR